MIEIFIFWHVSIIITTSKNRKALTEDDISLLKVLFLYPAVDHVYHQQPAQVKSYPIVV